MNQILSWTCLGAGLLTCGTPALAGEVEPDVEQRLHRLEDRIGEVERRSPDWDRLSSVVHLAGYAAVGYTDSSAASGAFDQVSFNPIFHYLYRDLLLLETEFEFEIDEEGETETALEYATLDLFLSDYAVLLAGKFLSPIGQFRQNLHPAWINKLPSAPPGFGHDGAAPLSEIGVQARGGFALAGTRGNYALFAGNGPRAQVEGGEIHGIESEGTTSNLDGDEVWGGRVGLVPAPGLEIGVSAATGRLGLFDGTGTLLESGRDYEVFGADFVFQFSPFEMRGEYVSQTVGAEPASLVPDDHEWAAWYGQLAYRILPTRWEAVVRYGDFDSPHADDDQPQWTAGADYWFAGNVVAKLAYEWNEGRPGTAAGDDRLLLQLAYGF